MIRFMRLKLRHVSVLAVIIFAIVAFPTGCRSSAAIDGVRVSQYGQEAMNREIERIVAELYEVIHPLRNKEQQSRFDELEPQLRRLGIRAAPYILHNILPRYPRPKTLIPVHPQARDFLLHSILVLQYLDWLNAVPDCPYEIKYAFLKYYLTSRDYAGIKSDVLLRISRLAPKSLPKSLEVLHDVVGCLTDLTRGGHAWTETVAENALGILLCWFDKDVIDRNDLDPSEPITRTNAASIQTKWRIWLEANEKKLQYDPEARNPKFRIVP